MNEFIPIKTDTIYIVTHAEAAAGADTLTDAGKAAAEALVARLDGLGVDGAFAAPSAAAQATIEPYALAKGLTIATLPDLRDHRLSLQGNRPDDPYLETRFKERSKTRPGGEPFDGAAHRLRNAIRNIARRPVVAPAMVTHPGLLAALLSQRDKAFGYADYLAMPTPGIWRVMHDIGTPRSFELI
ncbi:MAG: histidine phosphatase family protein [Pseudomonadota bacterium]